MNKKILGVCDLEKDYAEILSHYISKNAGSRFSVMTFSLVPSLMSFLEDGSLDVLLISDTFAAELDECDMVFSKSKRTFILTGDKSATDDESADDDEFKSDERMVIYKYQSAKDILAKILEGYKEDSVKKGVGIRATIIGVFSPIRRCGKTRFSYALSRELAKKARTVFVSLDDFCNLDILSRDEEHMSVSDFIYLAISKDGCVSKKIKSVNGVDVVLGANSPVDIRTSDSEIVKEAIKKILECDSYRYCVIDAGDAAPDMEKVLDICDVVYVPVISDGAAQMKLSEWVNYEREIGNDELAKHLQKIKLAGSEDELESVARDLVRPRR